MPRNVSESCSSDALCRIDIDCDDARWRPWIAHARAVLAAAAAHLDVADCEVSVKLADDATLAELNARFRAKNAPTNVLAFPYGETQDETTSGHLGDIAVSYDTLAREAADIGDHLAHLLIHGFLHLLGRRHDDDQAAAAMEGEEVAILATLGIADPYRREDRA